MEPENPGDGCIGCFLMILFIAFIIVAFKMALYLLVQAWRWNPFVGG